MDFLLFGPMASVTATFSHQPLQADYAWSRPGGLVEKPSTEANALEIWVYCDKFSYDIGETVFFKVHTTAEVFDIEIIRDGYLHRTVHLKTGIKGEAQHTPEDAYATGCGWKSSYSLTLDDSWEPAFYLVVVKIKERNGRLHEREGFFVVKSRQRFSDRLADADFVVIHTSCTMLAYNDWGGANHYRGIVDGYQNNTPTYYSSTQRPIARGMLKIPKGAPRESSGCWQMEHNGTPRYPSLEYSWYFRYSRHYADAGWATYERPFVVWAEKSGYTCHHVTQLDLHSEVDCLKGYKAAVVVGHDEYWTWEQRDTLDNYVESGGHFARFGGNFLWQVRLDAEMETQTCYKDPTLDPMTKIDPTRATTAWDWNKIGRPGAQSVGLTGLAGVYTRYGVATPRSSGGFQVYRPHHWVFEGSQLFYGDVIGGYPTVIAGFEVDGVDYTFRKGLPYATGADGAPENLEIIAMCPAVLGEMDLWSGVEPIGGPLREG